MMDRLCQFFLCQGATLRTNTWLLVAMVLRDYERCGIQISCPFLHSTEAEVPDGPSMKHTIYIVTEPVMPLSEKLKELNLGGTQRDEYFAWGLHQISKAVSFLNNDYKFRMAYGQNEQDMILLHHIVEMEYPDGH